VIDFARVRTLGGLAYGLELAEEAMHDQPVCVVPWAFVPLADLSASAMLEASRSLGSMVLRWSDAKEDEFTPTAHRGDKQRQINAIPAGQSIEQLNALTEAAAANMPATAAGAVLQKSLDPSPGCLFDLEVSNTKAEIELRTNSARLLVSKGSDAYVERIGSDERLPDRRTAECIIETFTSIVERLPTSRTGWHVEGAWIPSDTLLQILQLRPIPGDRPSTEPIPADFRSVAMTRFVWGVFDLKLFMDERRAFGSDGEHVAVVVRDRHVTRLEDNVVAGLATSEPVLLLNRGGGFRLTHEPFNLPEVKLRARFLAAHLPEAAERTSRIVSDGNTAYFRMA